MQVFMIYFRFVKPCEMLGCLNYAPFSGSWRTIFGAAAFLYPGGGRACIRKCAKKRIRCGTSIDRLEN
jgi:hypothetical protein